MKKLILVPALLALYMASSVTMMTSCNKPETVDSPDVQSGAIEVSGDISSNTTWDASKKYLLKGFVYVTNGATLTIPAGTIIMGDKVTKGTLVVTRGSRVMAEGTAAKPIIFTSNQPAGARREADWGGIILLGKSTVNPSGGEAKIEGGLVPTSGGDEKKYIWYGGTDVNDNSGVLKYVRIEFGGVAYSPDNEINGLTMGGVGAGTTISYVQIYRSGDDSYEWFGGTVNCDHLMATYSLDDDWDTDFGYSGRVQFGVSQRSPSASDVSNSNGFESDNDGNGSANMPQTKAIFANMTVIGPAFKNGPTPPGIWGNGAQIRRNSSISILNSVITGWPVGVFIDDSKGQSSDDADNGSLMFRGNVLANNVAPFKSNPTGNPPGWANTAAAWTWFNNSIDTAKFKLVDQTVLMVDAFKYAPSAGNGVTSDMRGRPNYLLKANSIALPAGPNGKAAITLPSGFTSTDYSGAFDASNDWTTGWSTFDAENNQY